jgi:ATP-dependent exoDNAse (exonuclease V) beta subunit
MTEEQELAIASDSPLTCVMAGPGSGKTRVLTSRVIEWVGSRKLALGRTLAITFTENAANEMKKRLTAAFEKLGDEEQLRKIETAYISTIHGFCARLLKENAADAGVDPAFGVLDEFHAALLKQGALAGLLDDWDRCDPEGLHEFSRHFKNKEYAGLLIDVYDTIRRLGHDPSETGALLVVREPFETVATQVRALAAPFAENGTPSQRRAALQVLHALAPERVQDARSALEVAAEAERAIKGVQRIGELRPALKETLKSAAIEWLAETHRRTSADLLGRLHAAYSERKRELSALDFEDLEQLAARMLRDRPAILQRVRSRFDETLVDEYQDTSQLQAEIIESLAQGRRLFVVGDPCQSIYGFRKAEPGRFRQVHERAAAAGTTVPLRKDFRTRPEVLAAVNCYFRANLAGFDRLLPGSAFRGKTRPSVELLMVGAANGDRDERRRAEARHIARRILELAGGELAMTHPDHEPRAVRFGDIALLFRSTTDIQIYERELDEFGIPYYSETGRGFYQTREVRALMSFLRLLDNSRNEIALASALRSPMFGVSDDALYLMARYAHSNHGVMADVLPEAAAIPGFPRQDAEAVARLDKLLGRLHAEAAWRPLSELIREIVSATAYDSTLLLEPNGRRKAANLHKLADVAASLEAGGFESTVNGLVGAIDRFRMEEVREGEAQIDSVSEDAVRLMTMHAAKGLEFPVVILPDLSRGPNRQRDYLDYLPEHGLGVQFNCAGVFDPPAIEKTRALLSIRDELDRREEEEEQRVLYVAMTRAIEHLVLSGCVKSKNGAYRAENRLAALCSAIGISADPVDINNQGTTRVVSDGEEEFELAILATDAEVVAPSPHLGPVAIRYRAALEAGASLPVPVPPEAEALAKRLVEQVSQPAPQPDSGEFLATVTDVLKFHHCPRRYYLGYYLGYPEGQKKPFPVRAGEPEEPEEDSAAGEDEDYERWELGRAVHDVLARGREALSQVPEPMRPEVQRLAEGFWSAAADEWARRVSGSSDARRELPLIASLKAIASLHDRFLRGTLDVLTFENARPALLLDYKANDIGAAEVDRETVHYRIQMVLYALLVQAVFGQLPAEAVLYFLAPGIARSIDLTPAALEEARSLLCSFFEAQKRLSFPQVVADHCYRCPYQGNLCRV